MKNWFTFRYSLLALICPILLEAQPLSELIKQVEENNLELKAWNQEYLADSERSAQVKQLPAPEIAAGAFIAPVETRLGAQQFRLGVSQMFPWFGTLRAREALAQTQAATTYTQISTTALALNYQLKLNYFKLYEIRTSQRIIRKNIQLLESVRQVTLAKVEGGRSTAADVLLVELQLRELEQQLKLLEKESEKPLADLNQSLNRPLNTPLQTMDTLAFTSIPYNKDTLLGYIQRMHPMVQRYELQQKAARQAIQLNELAGKPSFGLGIDYIMVDSRDDATPINNGRDILQLSLKASIPLWREPFKAKEREEKLRIAAIDNRQSDLESRLLATIEKAFADHQVAQLKQELYVQQVSTTQSAIQILQSRYSATGESFDQLLELETQLVNYELELLRATVQSHAAKAAIEQFIKN